MFTNVFFSIIDLTLSVIVKSILSHSKLRKFYYYCGMMILICTAIPWRKVRLFDV